MAPPYYPNCPACGHNASGIIGGPDTGRCSAFVPYPAGDPRGHAGYCNCLCAQDPVIKAWTNGEYCVDGEDGADA